MKPLIKITIILLGLILTLLLIANLLAELFWFQEVGYLSSFIKRILLQLGLWGITTIISALFLLGNLRLAQRLKWNFIPKKKPIESRFYSTLKSQKSNESIVIPQSIAIGFPWLLLIVIGLYVLICLTLIYYGKLAIDSWTSEFSIPNLTLPLSSPIQISWLQSLITTLSQNILLCLALSIIFLTLFIKPDLSLRVIAILLSFLLGLIWAGNWTYILKFFQATVFNDVDPLFHKNISFYIFKLPILQSFYFWFSGLLLYALLSVFLIYITSANSISEGKFPGFSRPQLRHLYGLWGWAMVLLVLHHILNRYELLYSSRGVVYGAGYTDIHVQQYIEVFLGIIAGISALWLFRKAIFGVSRRKYIIAFSQIRNKNFSDYFIYSWRMFPIYLWFIIAYIIIYITGFIVSNGVQIFVVQPNELIREQPYIENSIKYTRLAFDLTKIEAKTFNPEGNLTAKDILNNHLTIDNIRLWDTKPLLQTNRQLQQIRLYYKFPNAAIDRYLMKVDSSRWTNEIQLSSQTLKTQRNQPADISTEKQQVIMAARELDYGTVPKQAQTWVNKHLVYTHGYGFTLSPVNLVAEGGLPYYFVKDIETDLNKGALTTSSELIKYSIPITIPRIYYGQITDTYIMTSTKVKELDFPSGEENVYNTYDGTGGIKLGRGWRRLLFASYLKDWQMLFTRDFTPETKLLFRRNINERLQVIAPFLQYDRDPYLVVADIGDNPQRRTKNTLYWIVDAYTISDRYPYSDPGENKFNYIRNSVKVVIDAYNGDATFYIADAEDPIIKTWSKIFPELFQPLQNMPLALHNHIRYPEDYFSTQSERLLTYHMKDPQVFYNREDQWQIPKEIYGTEAKPVAPYYLIMELPESNTGEFILLHPYTPVSRPNLIAWLAGRSDGEQYGKLLLYQFPKQKLVYGPNQIEALINQDPKISQQISLWNREGSQVIQGNLLVIPIEQSLLYVEPLYLVAKEYGVPTLARVIVFYENQIVMAETLKNALEAIFQPEKNPSQALISPVE
jgi:uncharacterized membrane protein (UPF0182 family)